MPLKLRRASLEDSLGVPPLTRGRAFRGSAIAPFADKPRTATPSLQSLTHGKKFFQNVLYKVITPRIRIIHMNQIKAMVFANLLFLFITGHHLWVVMMLRTVKFYSKDWLFFSAEALFLNHQLKAAFIKEITVVLILVKQMRKLNLSLNRKFCILIEHNRKSMVQCR